MVSQNKWSKVSKMTDEIRELIEKGTATMAECYHCLNWVGGCTQKVKESELSFIPIPEMDSVLRRVRQYRMICQKFKTMG